MPLRSIQTVCVPQRNFAFAQKTSLPKALHTVYFFHSRYIYHFCVCLRKYLRANAKLLQANAKSTNIQQQIYYFKNT